MPIRVIFKQIFSLALIFNALITLAVIAGILFGFYNAYPYWHPFAPYLLDGNLFWIAMAAAAINIFPSACVGRALHTGRFLFHHYVYGFLVLLSSSVFVVLFTSVSLISLFLITSNNLAVNVGRFFILAGLTLLLDDLPDVSERIESGLNWVKSKACQVRKVLHVLQLLTGLASFYILVSVVISTILNPERVVSNSFLIGTLIVTSITSFACVKRKAWLKITPPNCA
ncbi:MAG: hypothetical protein M1167_06755 [Chloroflexi bacterium]|nr:hypothetical protein [Chloroflexota bacterium]